MSLLQMTRQYVFVDNPPVRYVSPSFHFIACIGSFCKLYCSLDFLSNQVFVFKTQFLLVFGSTGHVLVFKAVKSKKFLSSFHLMSTYRDATGKEDTSP